MKRVDDADPVVGLAGVEVFGEEFCAARGGGGGQDGGIPVGRLVTILEAQCGLHDRHGKLNNVEAQPVLDEDGGLLMVQRVRAGGTGGLDVKFLKHLNREGEGGTAEDGFGLDGLFLLARI